MLEKIGIEIRNHRKEAGLSKSKLARMANIHRNTLSLIESGKENATVIVLISICRAMKCSLSGILENAEWRELVER